MKVIELLPLMCDSFGLPHGSVAADADSDMVEEWDSLAQVDLIASLEAVAGDRFTAREISRLSSVASIATTLQNYDVACSDID